MPLSYSSPPGLPVEQTAGCGILQTCLCQVVAGSIWGRKSRERGYRPGRGLQVGLQKWMGPGAARGGQLLSLGRGVPCRRGRLPGRSSPFILIIIPTVIPTSEPQGQYLLRRNMLTGT